MGVLYRQNERPDDIHHLFQNIKSLQLSIKYFRHSICLRWNGVVNTCLMSRISYKLWIYFYTKLVPLYVKISFGNPCRERRFPDSSELFGGFTFRIGTTSGYPVARSLLTNTELFNVHDFGSKPTVFIEILSKVCQKAHFFFVCSFPPGLLYATKCLEGPRCPPIGLKCANLITFLINLVQHVVIYLGCPYSLIFCTVDSLNTKLFSLQSIMLRHF